MITRLSRPALVFGFAVLLGGCGLSASSRNPGYASFDQGNYAGLTRDTSISLGPTLMRFAAQQVDDDPQAQAMLSSIDGVRIQVYQLDGTMDLPTLFQHITDSADTLDEDWERVVRVVEDDSRVHVMIKYSDRAILGLALLAVDAEELVFVNVMGKLTTDTLSMLAGAIPEEHTAALAYLSL